MIYKSYLIEQNLSTIKTNINLFYGENFGLKNEFKEKLRTHYTKAQKFNINQELLSGCLILAVGFIYLAYNFVGHSH